MNQEEHWQKLLYLEIESHIKGQIQRENRLLQLRLLSFTIVTSLVSFIHVEQPFSNVFLFLVVTLDGLFVFDLYYCKLSKQESVRIRELTKQSKTKPAIEVDFFPEKDIPKVPRKDWLKLRSFDHIWYLIILVLSLFILKLKGMW